LLVLAFIASNFGWVGVGDDALEPFAKQHRSDALSVLGPRRPWRE
jgi:hypothetical protein